MICEVNINYRFHLIEFVLAIQLFGFMVHHYGMKPVKSWHNTTSRNTIESNFISFIYQNIQWTKIRSPKNILELLKCTRAWSQTLPVGTVLAAAIHVYTVGFGFPGYRQQFVIWFYLCVYVLMQYFVIFDCILLENKLPTTTATKLCFTIIYINTNGMYCHKSYVWYIKQSVQQPFRYYCRYILRIVENITPDAALALVVPEPSCGITFRTEHIHILNVKHCQFNESGSKRFYTIHGINGNITSKIFKMRPIAKLS